MNLPNKIQLTKRIHFERVNSTNTWAKKHFLQWAAEGVTLISAAEQTAGRGRFNRCWESPPNVNIYASFCFWTSPEREIGQIGQLLSLCTAKVLERMGFIATIKWPNDLLLSGKKVGGVLCETIMENNQRGVICAVGLNVNMPQALLAQIGRPATSLLVESGRSIELLAVSEQLQAGFLAHLNVFEIEGFDPFFSDFKARTFFKKGDIVHFHDNQTSVEAVFDELYEDGSVRLNLLNGESKLYYAGEFLE